jgi:hypothetical protein
MKTILLLFLIVVYSQGLLAQQVVATAGGTLSNASGSISYTIGEGVAQTLTKGDKILTQGFQQTTVTVTPITELKDLGFAISAFPNPTIDVVKLKLDTENVAGLQYLLFDMNGKLILRKNLESNETNVPVQELTNGIYILKVQEGTKELKTFKIVKQ